MSVTPAVFSGLVLLLLAAAPARAADAGAIVTGPPGSTAVRLGQDVADLARHFGVALEVVPSQGGLENIEALARRPGPCSGSCRRTRSTSSPPSGTTPSCSATPSCCRPWPRSTPRRSTSWPGPGSRRSRTCGASASRWAPRAAARWSPRPCCSVSPPSRPRRSCELGDAAALAALREGRIDAMIHVAGQPAPLLQDKVAIEDALHLVPVEHPALRDLYPVAVIPAGTYYPWQPEEVATVAPRAVLMTLRWAGTEARRGRAGSSARSRASSPTTSTACAATGHPKWREVDLAAQRPPAGSGRRASCRHWPGRRATSSQRRWRPSPPARASSPPGARTAAPQEPPAQQRRLAAPACSAEETRSVGTCARSAGSSGRSGETCGADPRRAGSGQLAAGVLPQVGGLLRHVPEHDVVVRLLHARVAGGVVEVDLLHGTAADRRGARTSCAPRRPPPGSCRPC